MEKIEFGLQSAVKSNPLGKFDVLISVVKGADLKSLNLSNYRILMETILAAQLSGKEILDLAQNKAVLFIERDAEVGIL